MFIAEKKNLQISATYKTLDNPSSLQESLKES